MTKLKQKARTLLGVLLSGMTRHGVDDRSLTLNGGRDNHRNADDEGGKDDAE
jgi:hypothetical protein